MAILPNSYGSVEEVAALTRRFTNAGDYDAATNPTLTQVEKFINRMSALLNSLLAKEGFAVPITQADAALLCAEIVVESAAELCNVANTTGRFFSDKALASGKSASTILMSEISTWLEINAAGIENLGAARSRSMLAGVAYRNEEEGGHDPFFQRDAFIDEGGDE